MKPRPRALISACLLGVACRYDGTGQALESLDALMERYELIPVCPEQLGGLPTPRTPAELRNGRVITRDGADVTDAFSRGAAQTCALARLYGAKLALLKARSPSCGSGGVYDGSFTGKIVPGEGVAAGALRAIGVRVYSEENAEVLLKETEVSMP